MKIKKFCKTNIAAMLVIGLMMAVCIVVSAKQTALVSDSDIRKADYIFLEAVRQKAEGNKDAYYDLVDAAYSLNPSDKYLAMEVGTRALLLMSPQDTAGEVRERALHMIRDYVNATPSDLYAGMMFAQLSTHLGHADEAVEVWNTLFRENGARTDIGVNYVDALLSVPDSAMRQRAMTVLDTLERREGIAPDFSMRRMRIYDAVGDTVAMKAEARKLLASSPTDIAYVSFVGRLYMELGDTDSALVYFNRAVELDPSSGAAYFNRAAYYNQLGDSVAYDREVFHALQQPDLDLEPKLEILGAYVIKLYRDSTQRGRITDLFQQLIEHYPHEPKVRNLYADYLVAVDDYAGAAEQKSYELDLNPANPKSWLMLSSLYMQMADYTRSRDAAMRGAHYYPEEVRLYELAAASDLSMENYDSALAILNKARLLVDSADYEQMSSIASQIGDVYFKLGKPDSVSHYYDEAVLYNPQNYTALNNYAYYLACTDGADLDRALTMIERVMVSRDDDPTWLDTYAWVLFKRRDYSKAREAIDKALDKSATESADILEHAGDIYFMDGKPEQAVDFWSRALRLSPDNQLLKRKVKHKTFFYN